MTTETIDWESLQSIKAAEPKRTTMLDILGVSAKEVYITQAYAYFLNQSSNSNLHKKFARIVFEELGEDIKDWTGYTVLPEVTVRCKVKDCNSDKLVDVVSRIDLLIITGEKAIILENKIYARFYNCLKNYILGVQETLKLEVKAAKFLSLSKYKDGLTHSQICKKMREELETSSERSELYFQFKEFIDHMIKISDVSGDNKDLAEYADKAAAITNAIALKERAQKYFSNLMVGLVESLIQSIDTELLREPDSSCFEEEKGCWIQVFPKKNNRDIYLTIAYEEFLKNGSNSPVYVIVESANKNDNKIEEYFKKTDIPGLKAGKEPEKEPEKKWRHYFVKEVAFSNSNDAVTSFEKALWDTSKELFDEIIKFTKDQGEV